MRINAFDNGTLAGRKEQTRVSVRMWSNAIG